MTAPLLALLPSPLLGPAVWATTARALEARGWTTVVAAANPAAGDEVAESLTASLPDDHDLVLVPHSNAGLFVALLASRLQVVGNVFVDAGVPPASGSTPLAPPQFYEFLSTLADDDGLLPPWTQWWADESLFPDEEVRRRVEPESSRLPLSYFAGRLDVPPGWRKVPSAYLAFGNAYAEECAVAAGLGWPVHTLAGSHLHMLFDPPSVADAIVVQLGNLGFG